MRQCKDKGPFPTHKKSHNPHPQGGGGEGGQDGYITLGGGGGGLAKPGSYIYLYIYIYINIIQYICVLFVLSQLFTCFHFHI